MGTNTPDDSDAVLKKIMADGTFDDIRQKVADALKKDETLKRMATDMVENSTTLSTADVQRPNKKALFESLRKELEQELLEKASQAAWKVMSSADSEVSKLIDEKVHEALCAVYDERRTEALKPSQQSQPAMSAVPMQTYDRQQLMPQQQWIGQQQYMQYGGYQYYPAWQQQ